MERRPKRTWSDAEATARPISARARRDDVADAAADSSDGGGDGDVGGGGGVAGSFLRPPLSPKPAPALYLPRPRQNLVSATSVL